MIKKIKICGIPPYYDEEQIIDAKHVNFVFGLNGSGKTTIGRYLQNPQSSQYENCRIEWENDPITCVVYNQDYVKANFITSSAPGIFTLGEENGEMLKQIETYKNELNELKKQRDSLYKKLKGEEKEGLEKQLADLISSYTDKFWRERQRLDKSPMHLAIKGNRGNKELFKRKLLETPDSKVEVPDVEKLEQSCNLFFNTAAEPIALLETPHFERLFALESSTILQKVVIGREDVNLSRLIKRLNNADWVRQGTSFLVNSEGLCPFCQKPIEQELRDQIDAYFDETYRADVQEIEELYTEYSNISSRLLGQLDQIIETWMNVVTLPEDLKKAYEKLKRLIEANMYQLERKKISPNEIVSLSSTKELANVIIQNIVTANDAIKEHNIKIQDVKAEQAKLSEQVWQYIRKELEQEIREYHRETKRLTREINSIKSELEDVDNKIQGKKNAIYAIEKNMTSVRPTAEGINNLLREYGFNSFSLEVKDSETSYHLVRDNGTPAFESLSEGERNLVTFLYFIYSLKGSVNETGFNDDKIVVIDDPVSSLDSDVLFLVSSLIRDFFEAVFNGEGVIKQFFIFSHNTYFFKEVSYKNGLDKKKTGYWTIRKSTKSSEIKASPDNPVASTYEMLWSVIKDAQEKPSTSNTITLANAMRRIIEHYFHFLGNLSLNKLHTTLPDGKRQVIKSLISGIHAGSHSAFDDFSATPNLYDAQIFLTAFRLVFEKMGHLSHYEMMMSTKGNPPK